MPSTRSPDRGRARELPACCRADPEEVQAILRRVVDDDKVAISITDAHGGSPMSRCATTSSAATTRLTSQFWPGVVTLPTWSWAGTDGRMLRQAGIPTYGVQGIFFDTSDIRFTAGDERVGVREFYEGQNSSTGW